MNRNIKLMVIALFGLSAGYVGQASAAPIFQLHNDGGFESGSENPAILDFSNPTGAGAPANTYETIQWITGTSPQSMLELFTVGNVGIDGMGGTVVISELQHSNNVIPAGTTYEVDTLANFKINDPTDTTTLVDLVNSRTTIMFLETANDGTCTDVFNGFASNNLQGSNCDDIYDVAFDDFFEDDQIFSYMGENYLLSFGLMIGAGTQFEVLGANEFLRVYAGEDGISEIFVTANIQRVPEPGSLVLMGIGLVGFGVSAIRKRRMTH